jgi:cation transport ATPase
MLTGDSPNCAKAIAKQLNLDDFRAGVLPEDKASYIESLKKEGNRCDGRRWY